MSERGYIPVLLILCVVLVFTIAAAGAFYIKNNRVQEDGISSPIPSATESLVTSSPVATMVADQDFASCKVDNDCVLINKEIVWSPDGRLNSAGLACGLAGNDCSNDYSADKWIGVNNDWLVQQVQAAGPSKNMCPRMVECFPNPAKANFVAKCISNICTKTANK